MNKQKIYNGRVYEIRNYTLVINGVEHKGDAYYFAALSGLTHDAMDYRLKQYAAGRFSVEEVMCPHKLNSNKKRTHPIVKPIEVIHQWILRKESWTTVKLKLLYLDIEPSAYMNQVRQ